MTLVQARSYTLGFTPNDICAVCTARGGAIVKGDVCCLCIDDYALISADGVTVTTTQGDVGSVFANVTKVYSQAVQKAGIVCVAMDDVADGATGLFQFVGICEARGQHSNNTALSRGLGLLLSSDGATATSAGGDATVNPLSRRGHFDGRQVSGSGVKDTRKLYGLVIRPLGTTPTSAGGIITVIFDGINGIGGSNS